MRSLDMTGAKHEKSKSPFTDDLERNPGIGQSRGSFMTGIPPDEIEGENTVEGDVDNDTTASDGVPERKRERTNPVIHSRKEGSIPDPRGEGRP